MNSIVMLKNKSPDALRFYYSRLTPFVGMTGLIGVYGHSLRMKRF